MTPAESFKGFVLSLVGAAYLKDADPEAMVETFRRAIKFHDRALEPWPNCPKDPCGYHATHHPACTLEGSGCPLWSPDDV